MEIIRLVDFFQNALDSLRNIGVWFTTSHGSIFGMKLIPMEILGVSLLVFLGALITKHLFL